MKKNIYSLILLASLFFISSINALNIQKFADLGDFNLENEKKIINCKIGYRTFGKLNKSKSNAILYPTWFGGTSEHVANLVSPDKLLDSTGFFIIIVDAFGNGISSSPSNYDEDFRMDFPKITIKDMVNSQYKLLTDNLNIKHLYGIIGGSMGSMQVFEWLVSYPDFIDKAIPYVCTPQPTSQDLLLMNVKKRILETGLKNNLAEEEILKTYDMLTAYVARTPEFRVKKTSYDEFPGFLSGFTKKSPSLFSAANRLCQLNALMNFNISSKFDHSMVKAASTIKAKVFMIVSSTDHIINPQSAIEFAKLINSDVLILENNCGHLAIACEMEKCAKAINSFFNQD